MLILKVAFYRGDGRLFNVITKWRTSGEHTHVELVFPDGRSFSSSQWDGGVRFKSIAYEPEKWHIVMLPLTALEVASVLEFCEREKGKKYDWRGILDFFAGKGDGDKNSWFCSEICAAALQQVGRFRFLTPARTSPEALWLAAMGRTEVEKVP